MTWRLICIALEKHVRVNPLERIHEHFCRSTRTLSMYSYCIVIETVSVVQASFFFQTFVSSCCCCCTCLECNSTWLHRHIVTRHSKPRLSWLNCQLSSAR